MKKSTLTVRIDEELREDVERIAKFKGRTLSEHLRIVLEEAHWELIDLD